MSHRTLLFLRIGTPAVWAVALIMQAADTSVAAVASGRARRHLGTSAIQIQPPAVEGALLSQIAYVLRPSTSYAGSGRLQYSLVSGPAGMSIDADAGDLAWRPPQAAVGTEVEVRLRATDGAATGEVVFALRVAAPHPVSTSLVGSTLTVTGAGTLQGMALAFPAEAVPPPSQLAVATLAAGDAPPLPVGITRLSDFFRVTPVRSNDSPIILTLPAIGLPYGRSREDVRLFVFSSACSNVGPDGEIGGSHWVPTWMGFDVLPGDRVTVELQGLGDSAFVGLSAPVPAAPIAPGPVSGTLRVGTASAAYACSPFVFGTGFPSSAIQVCGITGEVTMTVVVKHFSLLKTNPASTLHELLDWLVAGRTAFTALGLGADASLEVTVETMPSPSWLGFVSTGNLENRRVLHLTDAPEPKVAMQGTAVHEYFHHAQARTPVAGKVNLMDGIHATDWLVEGTARWFEDEVFDALDPYTLAERLPLAQVLAWGLAAESQSTPAGNRSVEISETRPYSRFAFFKMLRSSCTAFWLPHILNRDPGPDTRGLGNLKARVESDEWQCDFGAGFGDGNDSSLASALLKYTHATALRDDATDIDDGEAALRFVVTNTWQLLEPSPTCTSFDACPAGSQTQTTLVAAAAVPFSIAPAAAPPAGQGASVEVRSDEGRELWVWVGDGSPVAPLAEGTWTKTSSTWTHVYAPAGAAPAKAVVVVNPSTTDAAKMSIRATIGGGAVKFSKTRPYTPEDLEGPTFQVTASGTVTGPLGLTIAEAAPDPWDTDRGIRFAAQVPSVPATIVITGTLVAEPDATSGQVDYPDGSYHTWSVSNPRLAGDHGCGPGTAFSFTIPSWATWDTDRGCEVLWDTVSSWYDQEGTRTKHFQIGGGVMGVLKVDVIHQP